MLTKQTIGRRRGFDSLQTGNHGRQLVLKPIVSRLVKLFYVIWVLRSFSPATKEALFTVYLALCSRHVFKSLLKDLPGSSCAFLFICDRVFVCYRCIGEGLCVSQVSQVVRRRRVWHVLRARTQHTTGEMAISNSRTSLLRLINKQSRHWKTRISEVGAL